jgi:hypothetical protein
MPTRITHWGSGSGRRRRRSMASVIRLNPGGTTTMEKIGLSLEQAKELAARLREAGEPAGCAWCVGLDEEEEESDS